MNPIRNVTPDMLDPAVKPITEAAWSMMTPEERRATWYYAVCDTLYPPNYLHAAVAWTGYEYHTDPRKAEFREAAPNSLKTSESSPVEPAVPTTQSCSEIPDNSALKPSVETPTGIKHGRGTKPDLTDLPVWGRPLRLLAALTKVTRESGTYARDNWKTCQPEDFKQAATRHFNDWLEGNSHDAGTGAHHAVNIVWNLCAFLATAPVAETEPKEPRS